MSWISGPCQTSQKQCLIAGCCFFRQIMLFWTVHKCLEMSRKCSERRLQTARAEERPELSRNVPKHDFEAAQGVSRHFETFRDSSGRPSELPWPPRHASDYTKHYLWLLAATRGRTGSQCLEMSRISKIQDFETFRDISALRIHREVFRAIWLYRLVAWDVWAASESKMEEI